MQNLLYFFKIGLEKNKYKIFEFWIIKNAKNKIDKKWGPLPLKFFSYHKKVLENSKLLCIFIWFWNLHLHFQISLHLKNRKQNGL